MPKRLRKATRGILVGCVALCLLSTAVYGNAFGDMALAWILGDYRSPLLCNVGGEPYRVLRRIRLTPKKRSPHRPTVRIQLYDLESPEETRCYSEDGADQENWIGFIEVIHESRRDRPDLAEREFADSLRREGGFSFRITKGKLRHGAPGLDPKTFPVLDFEGGSVTARKVEPGQDAYRRLADFGERRKMTLQLEAPDGTTLTFDLAQIGG